MYFPFAIAVKVYKMRKHFRVHFRTLYLFTFALLHFRIIYQPAHRNKTVKP